MDSRGGTGEEASAGPRIRASSKAHPCITSVALASIGHYRTLTNTRGFWFDTGSGYSTCYRAWQARWAAISESK